MNQQNRKRKITSFFDISSKDKKSSSEEQYMAHKSLVIAKRIDFSFTKTCSNGLNVDYGILFQKSIADYIFNCLEDEIEYDKKSQVKIYGKTFDVHRKQTAYGDKDLTYTFSGVTVPAKKWNETLYAMKNVIEEVSHHKFNFVLVNRYDNGSDYMSDHQDDEKDLVDTAPIASVSLGQHRDFVFKHKSSRSSSCKAAKCVPHVKILLEHGSLLVMHPPTNALMYHGLPKRSVRTCPNPRINLTFRDLKVRRVTEM